MPRIVYRSAPVRVPVRNICCKLHVVRVKILVKLGILYNSVPRNTANATSAFRSNFAVASPLIKIAWIILPTNATLWKIVGNFARSASSINAVNVALVRYANSLCTLLKSASEFYQFSLAYGSHNGRKSLSVINEVNNVAYRHERRKGPFNGSLVPGDINEIQRVCSSTFRNSPIVDDDWIREREKIFCWKLF